MSQVVKTINVDHLKIGDVVSILKIEILHSDSNGNFPNERTVVITSGIVVYICPGSKGKTEITIKSHDGRTLNYAFIPGADTVSIKKGDIRTAELYIIKGILSFCK